MRKGILLSAFLPVLAVQAEAQVPPAPVEDIPDPAPPSAVTRSFTVEDFTRFAPKTALDMVQQIPGFQIEQQDNSQRGFGQATGNVLINGQRLSGKSNDAVEALGRIPATSVIQIDMQDGAQMDIPGLSGQVVNVIATQATGLSGAWATEFVLRENLDPSFLNGEFAVSGALKDLTWTLSLENENPRRGNAGIENLLDETGTVIEVRDEETRFANEEPSIALALVWRPDSGAIANLNLSYEQENFEGREIRFGNPVNLPDENTLRIFNFGTDGRTAEISGDFEFGLGPGRLKLIGVQTLNFSKRPNEVVTTQLVDNSSEGSLFVRDTTELESIIRFEYALSPKPGRDWQISLEGAFNTLDNTSDLFDIDGAGALIPTDLQDDNTRVEELRAEANITHGRKLTKTLNAQISLGVEASELAQSGPTGLTRFFFRPKGFVSLAWTPSSSTTISTRIEREVGQLDFSDFVSTVNLNLSNEQLGNPDLVPEQSWTGEIVLEQRFGDVGAITIRPFGELITDIIDQVPIGDEGEAPGNLDSATRYGIEINATFRFDRFGARGLQFEFEGLARNSSLDDPLTGISRRINRDRVSRVFSEIRYDTPFGPYAVGVNYRQGRRARNFRLDQSQFEVSKPGNLGLFFEHKDIFGLIGTFSVSNLLGTVDIEERIVFVDRRNNSPVDFSEFRDRTFGPIFSLGLRGSF